MTTLALTDEHAQLGKISNNLELHGDEDRITGFTLPLRLRLDRPQLLSLMGEKFDACAWDTSGGCVDWLSRVLPLELGGEVYVDVAAILGLGGRELEFTDCRVSHITLLAFGLFAFEVKCHLYVRPGIGSENLLLQEYQEQEVAVTMSLGKLRIKADKAQQSLALEEPKPKSERELAHERGEEVEVITTVVDDQVTHDHPGFNDGKPIMHTQGATCFVCEGQLQNAIGSPEEERERARAREQDIAQQLADAHAAGRGPGDEEPQEDAA